MSWRIYLTLWAYSIGFFIENSPHLADFTLLGRLIDGFAVGRNLASQLLKMKLVSGKEPLEFCSCNDEKEQFREARRLLSACESSFEFKETGSPDSFDFW